MRVGPAAAVSLSELDRRIIGLVSDQRVVTSTQLELLLADVPGRTLRYRTDHLHRAGLVGRSRPYRERGSAPYHLWPSRRADTLARRGAPVPRGGERAVPNPLFLAHAAGVTEIYALLATEAHPLGLRLDRFVREPREQFQAEGRSRTLAPDALLDCLLAAHAPYDTARAQEQAEREATEAERQRLCCDPHARRALLQEHRLYARCDHVEQFGMPGARALELLLASIQPMDEIERAAFAALARQLDPDPLQTRFAPEPVPLTPADREAVQGLAALNRARQDKRISELAGRHGFGPKLRRYQQQLASGGLIDLYAWERVEQDAAGDERARTEQERLRVGYLAWRGQEAKRRKHDVPLHVRLAQGRAAALTLIDGEQLRICPACDEIAYPSEPASHSYRHSAWQPRHEPPRCHFCGAYQLDDWDQSHAPELHHGGAYQPSDLDLRSPAGSGLLDRAAVPFGDEQEEQWS